MALDPHLFTASHLGRQRLRDRIIDLNQSMDLDDIVTKVLATLRKAAKTHPFARHFLYAHTPAERRRIVETNLRRLRIRFAAADTNTVAGAQRGGAGPERGDDPRAGCGIADQPGHRRGPSGCHEVRGAAAAAGDIAGPRLKPAAAP